MHDNAIWYRHSVSCFQINLEKALEDGRLKADQIGELKKTVSEHLDTIADMKGELREEESIRRKLHNTIQELKVITS